MLLFLINGQNDLDDLKLRKGLDSDFSIIKEKMPTVMLIVSKSIFVSLYIIHFTSHNYY